jgi:prepilin peptidase CpaA
MNALSQLSLDSVLIAYVITVALVDWRTHRIPNLLSGLAAIIGIALQLWQRGEAGFLIALGGMLVGLGMFLPFYLLRAFGAGDVKAMACVGIFLGMESTMLAVALTLIAGAVMGAIVLLSAPAYASAAVYRLIGMIVAPLATLRNRHQSGSSPQPRLRFPYGVAIAVGTAAATFLTGRIQP